MLERQERWKSEVVCFVVILVLLLFVSLPFCFALLKFSFGVPLQRGGEDMEGLPGKQIWGVCVSIGRDYTTGTLSNLSHS